VSYSPLVSVIVPSYNTAKYVPDAVRSILSQSYQNLEVHVVDDGSKDNTREVMQQFAADPRVIYHYQENRGESGARNTGIRAAKGELIALLDADDLWMPRKLELQVPCFAAHPKVGVVYTNTVHVDANNQEIATYRTARHNGRITEKLFGENFVTGATSMFRRECFDGELYDESLKTCADYDISLRLSVKYEFFYLDEITYRYRIWPGQVSNARNLLRFHDDSVRMRTKFLERWPDLLPKAVVDEMWAEMYASRAITVMRLDQKRLATVGDILTSLKIKPTRLNTWKAAGKILLNRVS
jgi:glycosyltransferase involved in cell wall biosynthesis